MRRRSELQKRTPFILIILFLFALSLGYATSFHEETARVPTGYYYEPENVIVDYNGTTYWRVQENFTLTSNASLRFFTGYCDINISSVDPVNVYVSNQILPLLHLQENINVTIYSNITHISLTGLNMTGSITAGNDTQYVTLFKSVYVMTPLLENGSYSHDSIYVNTTGHIQLDYSGTLSFTVTGEKVQTYDEITSIVLYEDEMVAKAVLISSIFLGLFIVYYRVNIPQQEAV